MRIGKCGIFLCFSLNEGNSLERKVKIVNKLGLHVRPATALVKMAAKYPKCTVFFEKDGVEVNAKSIMGVLILAAEKGSVLTIRVSGENEAALLDELALYFEKGFEEEM